MSRGCNVKQRLGQARWREKEHGGKVRLGLFATARVVTACAKSRGAESKEEGDESPKGEP